MLGLLHARERVRKIVRERKKISERVCVWERVRVRMRQKKTSLRDLISLWICGSGTFLKKRFQSILAPPTDYNEPGPTLPTPLQSNFLTPTPSMEDMIWYSETMCVYAFVRLLLYRSTRTSLPGYFEFESFWHLKQAVTGLFNFDFPFSLKLVLHILQRYGASWAH